VRKGENKRGKGRGVELEVGEGAARAVEEGEAGSRAQCIGHGSRPAGRGRIPGERRSRQRGGRRRVAAREGGRTWRTRSERGACAVKAEIVGGSALSASERAKTAEGPEDAGAGQGSTWVELAELSPARGPADSRASDGCDKENSSSSWPWRRASSETMKLARRGEATVSRNMLWSISRTASFSKRDPRISHQPVSICYGAYLDTSWILCCFSIGCFAPKY
jgi:hypothetical protein